MMYSDIRKEVGHLRGYGLDIDEWTAEQKELVELILKRGTNKFYTGASYDWNFLKPLVTLTILDDSESLLLPVNFAYLIGEIYFDGSNAGCPLAVENEAVVFRRRNSAVTSTGIPQFACITPEAPGSTHGPRQLLSFWPTADQDYEITFRYSVLPEALSTAQPYPYGGQAHSNTILEACLAASEQMDGNLGIHTILYSQALSGSIEHDRRTKAQALGTENRLRRPYRYSNIITPQSGFYNA